MERCLTLLITRQMQIKTTMRYHLTLVRMAIIKKTTNNKGWQGCGENGTLVHHWWECKVVHLLGKTVQRLLKKLKIELPLDPAIPFWVFIWKKMKALTWKDTCIPMFIAALFTTVKIRKQPKCPTVDEWIKKMWCVYMCVCMLIHFHIYIYYIYAMENYSAIKNCYFQIVVLEKILESPLDSREIKSVHPKGNQPWIFIGRTDAEAEAPILWPPDVKNWLVGKDLDAGKDWGQEEKGITEDEMARSSPTQWTWIWANSRRQWNAGQGKLTCCSPWSCK